MQSAAAHKPAAARRQSSSVDPSRENPRSPRPAPEPAPTSPSDPSYSEPLFDQAESATSSTSTPPAPVETLGPLALHVPRHPTSASRPKHLGSSEKHALAGGFFVMFGLAIAFAIGWWMTPASPPNDFAESIVREAPARDIGPEADAPAVSSEMESDSESDAGMASKAIDIEATPVEEVSVLPSTSGNASSSLASKNENAATMPAPIAQSATANRSSTSTAKNSAAGAKAAKQEKEQQREDELQRLKAQAYSETRKDRLGSTPKAKPATEGGTGPTSSSSGDRAASVKRVDLSQAVAECNNESGLFYRERCKWRLCNGRWGKQGCPSYQNDSRASWNIS